MPPRFYKHKLLLDEGIYPRKLLHRTNSRFNIKHIKHDLKRGDTGVIGITQKLTPEQLDTKLNALLSKSSEKSFYGKYTPLEKG